MDEFLENISFMQLLIFRNSQKGRYFLCSSDFTVLNKPITAYNGAFQKKTEGNERGRKVSKSYGTLVSFVEVYPGLNKGEARNTLARAVFFNRLGEMRERSFENQRYRASGLNLVIAAIVLWNTVYLERAIKHMKDKGQPINESLLQHLSPLGWEHINFTGDYVWRQNKLMGKGELRPLRESLNP